MVIFLLFFYANAQDCGVCCSLLPQRNFPLTFYYYQNTGRLVGGTGDYFINTIGYSGNDTNGIHGRNNPIMQYVSNIGPAPANNYTVGKCSDFMHVNATRPCSFPLNPNNAPEMHGRFGIWLHGCQCCSETNPTCDYSAPPCGYCSEGCIIISRSERVKIRTGDTVIVKNYDPAYLRSKENKSFIYV